MEKKIIKFGATMLALLMCVSFTSCSSDDDEGGGSDSGTLSIGSEKISLPYAYYYNHDDGRNGSVRWEIEFLSYDYISMRNGNIPQAINVLAISLDGNEGTELPVGEFANAHLYVVKGMSRNDEGQQYEGNATVTIGKSGSNYTVAFSNATIGDDIHDLNGVSFNYTGGMTALPKEYQD